MLSSLILALTMGQSRICYANFTQNSAFPQTTAEARGPAFEEAADLVEVGPNLVGRMQRLTPRAAREWRRWSGAAEDGMTLLIVSGSAVSSIRRADSQKNQCRSIS